jgi:hypothetical protein
MIRWRRMSGAALVLLAAQGIAVAGVSADAAQELVHKSGLWGQLESLGSQVRGGMAAAAQKSPGKFSAEQTTALFGCVDSSYAPADLRAIAVDAVAGALTPADLPALQAWYDGPLGHKIAATEERSAAEVTDPQERLRRGGEALAAASEARKTALQAILTETHSVDIMTDTVIEMAVAVQQGMAGIDPAAGGPSAAELKANLVARRPLIAAHYTQLSLPAYAFTYVALGDDELKQYAEHLDTPSARAFNDASVRGVVRALNAGSVRLGRCLQALRPASGS